MCASDANAAALAQLAHDVEFSEFELARVKCDPDIISELEHIHVDPAKVKEELAIDARSYRTTAYQLLYRKRKSATAVKLSTATPPTTRPGSRGRSLNVSNMNEAREPIEVPQNTPKAPEKDRKHVIRKRISAHHEVLTSNKKVPTPKHEQRRRRKKKHEKPTHAVVEDASRAINEIIEGAKALGMEIKRRGLHEVKAYTAGEERVEFVVRLVRSKSASLHSVKIDRVSGPALAFQNAVHALLEHVTLKRSTQKAS